jgi:glycosyltransferase involved in cell wall biosynthesis
MKIIYDCTVLGRWNGHATGIQRVVEELGKELVTCMPNSVAAIFNKNGECFKYDFDQHEIGEVVIVNVGDLIISTGHDWDYIDHFLMLQSYFEKGVLFGALFHDVIPLKFPFSYDSDFVERFEFWIKKTLSTVNFAFANSESTARDVIDYAKNNKYNPPKIHVLRLGDHLPVPLVNKNISEELIKKTSCPYILSVGTIEFRKNHSILLNAYRYLLEDMNFIPPKLYIIGKQGALDGGIKNQAEKDIRFRGLIEVIHGLNDNELREFYSSALFTVYPSIYEGWGLPVAESLFFGKPCIASRSSSMVEIAPMYTRFAHPLKVEEWARHIKELSEDKSLLESESFRIKNEYIKVSWADTARQMREILISNNI